MRKKLTLVLVAAIVGLQGCQPSIPKDVLKPDANVLAMRSLQTRSYDTLDEKNILSASAAALQDMGFTLEESETKLGLIVAGKEADATNKGQVALATASLLTAVLAGGSAAIDYGELDDVQKVRAALVTHVNLKQKKTFVRLTFQRIVWNKNKQISRMETLNDSKLYQGFFERLSKAVFLEEHQI